MTNVLIFVKRNIQPSYIMISLMNELMILFDLAFELLFFFFCRSSSSAHVAGRCRRLAILQSRRFDVGQYNFDSRPNVSLSAVFFYFVPFPFHLAWRNKRDASFQFAFICSSIAYADHFAYENFTIELYKMKLVHNLIIAAPDCSVYIRYHCVLCSL